MHEMLHSRQTALCRPDRKVLLERILAREKKGYHFATLFDKRTAHAADKLYTFALFPLDESGVLVETFLGVSPYEYIDQTALWFSITQLNLPKVKIDQEKAVINELIKYGRSLNDNLTPVNRELSITGSPLGFVVLQGNSPQELSFASLCYYKELFPSTVLDYLQAYAEARLSDQLNCDFISPYGSVAFQ